MKPLSFIIFLASLMALFTIISCDSEDTGTEPIYVKTSYVEVDSVFSSKVTFGGEITKLPDNATDYGFVFGLSETPEIETDSLISLGKPDFEGDFFELKSGLKSGIQYYVRAYLTVNNKTYYGEGADFSMSLITNIQPAGAGRSDTIVIHGVNFSSNINENIIKLDDVNLDILSVNSGFLDEQIKVVLPSDISLGEKTVSIEINDTKSEYGEKFIVDPYIAIPNFPGTKRNQTVAFTINDIFYIGTGYDENNNYTNDFYSYTPSNNIWAKITDYPGEGRSGAVAFVINGKAYVGLGQNNNTFFTNFYMYSPEAQEWTSISDFPGQGRVKSATFSINNNGYIILGSGIGYNKYNDSYLYDSESDIWQKLNDFPYPPEKIGTTSSFRLNKKGYILLDIEIDSKLLRYDSDVDTWNEIDDPDFSVSTKSFVLNNEIYNFHSLEYYCKYMNSWWDTYLFNYREGAWCDVGISNGEYCLVGMDSEEFSNNLWLFNPE